MHRWALRPFWRSGALRVEGPRAWLAPAVEQHQDLQLAFAGAPPGQGEIEAAFAVQHVAVALLQGNHRPAHAGQHLPEMDPQPVDDRAALVLIAAVEWGAVGDAAGFAVEPGKAPALGAEPADILVRVAPAGKFPVEDAGQPGAIEQIISGAEIVVAQHGGDGRGHMRLEPADAPLEHRTGRRMAVEIGAKPGNLLRRPTALIGRQKAEIGPRRPDCVYPGDLLPEPLGDRR